jgi:hypothetical protein
VCLWSGLYSGLNLYLTCIPCLAPEGKDVLANVQAQHTYVKPKGSENSAATAAASLQATSNASPGAALSHSFTNHHAIETSGPSLNQTIVPKFVHPSFPTNLEIVPISQQWDAISLEEALQSSYPLNHSSNNFSHFRKKSPIAGLTNTKFKPPETEGITYMLYPAMSLFANT